MTTINAPDPRRWYALAVLSLAQLVVIMGDSIVNISLPDAAADLGISDASRSWAVTSYVLSFGGFLLLAGRIADTVGRKRALIVGLLGLAAASVIGGSADSAAVFFSARALQGAFAALLTPAALSLVTVIFTVPRERTRAFGVYGAVSGAGAALGVVLGGLLTEIASWRWCLLVNVPIAIIAAVGAAVLIRESRAATRTTFDLPGALLVTVGVSAVVLGFAQAADRTLGWTSPTTTAPIAVGLVLLAAFVVVVVERRAAHPLVPLRLVLDRARAAVLGSAILVNAGLFAVFLFLAYYLQQNLGMSPLEAGLAFLPCTAGIVIVSIAGAPLVHRFGPRTALLIGTAVATAGLGCLSLLTASSTYPVLVLPAELLIGIGMGLVFVGQPTLIMNRISGDDVGTTSALLNTSQQLGGALGTALLTTVYASAVAGSGAGLLASVDGYRSTFTVCTFLLAAAFVVVTVSPRRRSLTLQGVPA